MLGALLKGRPTVIAPEQTTQDMAQFIGLLAERRVTRLWVVPSLLRSMLNTYPDLGRRLPDLRFWVSSGEALSLDLWEQFRRMQPRAALYTLYGTSGVLDAT